MSEPTPEKILIVDDDPAFLELLRSHLRSFNRPFAEARDGIEALERLRQGSFALVISDLKMPRMDGMALLHEVRSLYPDTGVIVITGYGDGGTYTEVIQAGAIDFLTKPFFRDELAAKINRALREQRLIGELNSLIKALEGQLAEKNATIEKVRSQLAEAAERMKQLQAKAVFTTYGPHRVR